MFPMKDVDGVTAVFGCRETRGFMPDYKDIPAEFKDTNNPWAQLQCQWFFAGLTGVQFIPKPGVDKGKAMSHLHAIQCSFEPAHEHKAAGVAFLMHEWFDDVLDADGKSMVAVKKG